MIAAVIGVLALVVFFVVNALSQNAKTARRARAEAAQAAKAVEACRGAMTELTGTSSPLRISYGPAKPAGNEYTVRITIDGGAAGGGTVDCTSRETFDGSWKAAIGRMNIPII